MNYTARKFSLILSMLFIMVILVGCGNSSDNKKDNNGNKKIKDITSRLNFADTPYVAQASKKYYHSKNSKITDQFFIGSMTKVFTATLIFHLQKQGSLNIDDNISQYFTNPDSNFTFNKSITIKELLSHTSGIREDEARFMQDAYDNQAKKYSLNEVLGYGEQTTDKSYEYANTNYVLLGEIIKSVTNKTFDKYVHEIIIDPLNLQDTCIMYEDANCDPTRGYIKISGEYKQITSYNSLNTIARSAGNLVSTIKDLETFLKELISDHFFNFDKMTTTGTDEKYKYGIELYKNNLYGHSGGTLDSASFMLIDTATKNVDVLLTGESSLDVQELLYYLRD